MRDFCKKMSEVFEAKNRLYGRDNVDAESVTARMADKLARLKHATVAGAVGDSVYDACVDMANYAYIFSELTSGRWHAADDAKPTVRTGAMTVGEVAAPQKPGDVGYDLKCLHDVVLPPHVVTQIDTGARILAPTGVWYRIAGRSSLHRRGVIVLDNVIDTEYTGFLVCLAYNTTDEDVSLTAGERVAQVVFFQAVMPRLEPVAALPSTTRGDSGFGSTGR